MSARPDRYRRALLVITVALGCCAAGCGTRPSSGPVPAHPTPTVTTPIASPASVPTASPTVPSPEVGSTPSGAGTRVTPSRPVTSPSPAPTPPAARCVALAASLSLRDQVGQLIMVAVPSTGVDPSAAAAIKESRAGSVILLGNTSAGISRVLRVTDRARAAARTPKSIDTLLAADQEGGLVQRLRGKGFNRIPSARQQVEESPAELKRDAARWGTQLRRAGIDANLAPVADVVPKDLVTVNQPIGVLRRGYGSDPTVAASHVAAFVEGMDAAGIAAAVKHFPGLGRVRGNTDFARKVVDDSTERHDASLQPFAAGVAAGTDMVMMSSAYYSKIDPNRRAAFSPVVIKKLVRGDLGFTGVVISDDLAAAAMQDLEPGERMLRFLRAGGDVAIVGDPAIATRMADAVVDEARDDDKLAAAIQQATIRVLRLKDRRGLADC